MALFTLSTNPPGCMVDVNRFPLGKPTVDLFDGAAKELAEEISDPKFVVQKWDNRQKKNVWKIERSRDANKPTQIRKFYDELNMWSEKTASVEDLSKNLPYIRMMNAKVAYAHGRKHVDDKFSAWFSECMNQVSEATENGLVVFRNFRTLFEAFLGFYKECRPK